MAAAGALGVGRPALPNLLNEIASLSPEMALPVEKAAHRKMKFSTAWPLTNVIIFDNFKRGLDDCVL
jgi:hypothetical protein